VVTLINSVLLSIPFYAMSNTWVPNSTLLAIERKCCNFLWGGRKVHAVSWDIITKPKSKGTPEVHDMVTLLAKHAGKAMVEEDNLWVASVKCKYGLAGSCPRKTPLRRCSRVWSGAHLAAIAIQDSCRVVIGDGTVILVVP